MATQWRIMDITTALLTREIGCCCCAWGRTCFSDLRFSFDLVNVFFIFFALQSLCRVSFFISSSICAWYLSFYRVIQVCACVFFFSFLWLFVSFYIALYLCLHETTSLIFLIDLWCLLARLAFHLFSRWLVPYIRSIVVFNGSFYACSINKVLVLSI